MFQPIVPLGGLVGWQFLQRTEASQREAFSQSAAIEREAENFRNQISSVRSAEDLVGDFRLRRIALGAFGLTDDINNNYLIQRVLQEGIDDPADLANRLSDSRYSALAQAFSFGSDGAPGSELARISETVRGAAAHLGDPEAEAKAFDLVAQLKALSDLAGAGAALEQRSAAQARIDNLWPEVMGERSLRAAFKNAFDIAPGFDALPENVQQEVLRQKIVGVLGERPASDLVNFAESIIANYVDREFERAVGEQNEDMRLALNLRRELPAISGSDASEDTQWFRVMGSPPLRRVFETVLGLPKEFAALDIDRQLETFKEKATGVFGSSSVSQFSNPDKLSELTKLYLLRAELGASSGAGTSSSNAALTILSQVSSGSLFSLLG